MAPVPPTSEGLVGGYFVIVYLSLMWVVPVHFSLIHNHELIIHHISLYGIFIAQAYEYALHAREDPNTLKYTVLAVAYVSVYSRVVVHVDLSYHPAF